MSEKILATWRRKIRKYGRSYYIAIPPELIEASGVRIGDPLTLELLSNGMIMIEKKE
jgi:antitoxin component of MazEF toxin-antitoxin module